MSYLNMQNTGLTGITKKTLTYGNQKLLTVIDLINLTSTAYIMRLERNGIKFKAGQHISLGINNNTRQYSIYSGERDNYIDVLIKEVETGEVSKQLKRCKLGDKVSYNEPIGYFRVDPINNPNTKYLFIASGTGIAPFHSFIRSYPDIDYKIIHSVRYSFEAYGRNEYDPSKYTLCATRDDKGNYFGRVTEYLKENPIDNNTQVYLCGNCDMIHNTYDILIDGGLPAENLHSEVYF